MKKITLIILGIFLFSFLVYAIGEGDEVSQEQLDSINADTIGLQCRVEDSNLTKLERTHKVEGKYYYVRNVSCLDIEKIDDDLYKIVRNYHYPNFRIREYIRCVLSAHPIPVCNQYFNQKLRDAHQSSVRDIRHRIKLYQTETESDLSDFDDELEV